MAEEALLSSKQHQQLAFSIICVANDKKGTTCDSADIKYCQDIIEKINGTKSERQIATSKISSKLNRINFKHNEADLFAIADILSKNKLLN